TPAASEGRPAWSPDGASFAFLEGGNIWRRPATGGAPTQITTAPGNESDPAWSADSSVVSYSVQGAGDSTIWVANADGTNNHQVTIDPGGPSFSDLNPSFSPAGDRIMFSRLQGTF